MNNRKRIKSSTIILLIGSILCNISQIPALWDSGWLSYSYQVMWVLLFLGLVTNRKYIINSSAVLLLLAFLDMLLVGYRISVGWGYVDSDLFIPIHMSMFIFLIGGMLGVHIQLNEIKLFAKVYCVSVGVVAIFVYANSFRGVDWANAKGYIYAAKNSVATIFLIAIVFCYVFLYSNRKILWMAYMLALTILIFIMKARASIITLIVLITGKVFSLKDTVKKIGGIVLICAMIYWIYQDEQLHTLIIDQILLNNANPSDLSLLTSGRTNHWAAFRYHFPQNWLLGTGGSYLEAMPLAALLSYGLLAGVLVIVLALYPIYVLFKSKRIFVEREIQTILLLLIIIVCGNGLFEELAPFGPGVKCYALWLIAGIVEGRINYENKRNRV